MQVEGEPTSAEAEAIADDFKALMGSDLVLVIGDETADVWSKLESDFGWRTLEPAHQKLLQQLLGIPVLLLSQPSQEELAEVRARVTYARSEPGRVRDYQSLARPTPDWVPADQGAGVITCDKPQGPPVKLMGEQTGGIEPPYAGTYQRAVRGLSMGCLVEDPVCSICGAKGDELKGVPDAE